MNILETAWTLAWINKWVRLWLRFRKTYSALLNLIFVLWIHTNIFLFNIWCTWIRFLYHKMLPKINSVSLLITRVPSCFFHFFKSFVAIFIKVVIVANSFCLNPSSDFVDLRFSIWILIVVKWDNSKLLERVIIFCLVVIIRGDYFFDMDDDSPYFQCFSSYKFKLVGSCIDLSVPDNKPQLVFL